MPDPLRLNPAKIHAILVVSIYFTRRKVSKVSTSPYPFISKRYEWHMIIAHCTRPLLSVHGMECPFKLKL
jgi:hypothetical protein